MSRLSEKIRPITWPEPVSPDRWHKEPEAPMPWTLKVTIGLTNLILALVAVLVITQLLIWAFQP